MARIILFISVLIFFNADVTSAQFDTLINLKQQNFIEGSYSDFYIDNLNNIYLLNKNNQLKKLNANGDSVAVSNALKKYGDIYSVDVSNPLKILVYYKDFSTLVILDRFLSSLNTIDLRSYGILQAQAVAHSYDNNYWVFDAVENKLKKINDNGSVLLQTPDFRTIFSEKFSPEKIIDNNGFVYLYDTTQGWLVFDYYGAFKQNIPQPSLNNVQIIKNELYGFDAVQNLHRYNTQTFKESIYHFSEKISNPIKMRVDMNSLYVLANDGLYIFSIEY
jgi:hypothetical protein